MLAATWENNKYVLNQILFVKETAHENSQNANQVLDF